MGLWIAELIVTTIFMPLNLQRNLYNEVGDFTKEDKKYVPD